MKEKSNVKPPASNNTSSSTGNLTPKEKSKQGGTEDLMVTGTGGTLPIDKSDTPHYYKNKK